MPVRAGDRGVGHSHDLDVAPMPTLERADCSVRRGLYGALMSAWAPLPMPGELVRLALPCPPQLVELVGYDGPGRLLALWWAPFGDGLTFSDGTLTATGNWRGWLSFCEHPLVRVFLEDYQLGDSQDKAEHGCSSTATSARSRSGWPAMSRRCSRSPRSFTPSPLHLSPSAAQALLERARDAHVERTKSAQELQAARGWREREQELLEQLTALLDDALRAVCELSP